MRKSHFAKIILFLVGFIFLNTPDSISKDYYIYRLVRDMQTKEEIVVNSFVPQLLNKLGDKISIIYLIPEDLREERERIDIVIIYEGIEREEVLDVATDIAYQICKEWDEVIAPVAFSKEEFDRKFSIFSFWEILEEGSYLYINSKGNELFMDVSEKYINIAEEGLGEGDFYHSLRSLYYAVLSLLNATIGEAEGYPKERPDIFDQFRKNFILTEKVPPEWNKKINHLIELNEKLNQNPDTEIDREELTSVMDFVRNLYLSVKH